MKNKMKKYLLTSLFTFVGLFVVGVMNVEAKDYDVYVKGVRLTDTTNVVTCGDGTLTYNDSTKEIILDNATITSDLETVDIINITNTTETFKIVLKGNNTITVTGKDSFAIRTSKNIIISGDGKLTAQTIYPTIKGEIITIDGAKLDLTNTKEYSTAIEAVNGLFIKNGSKVEAKGWGSAISSFVKMEISDSELFLEATGDQSNAIFVKKENGVGTLVIKNSKIKAKSGYANVYSASTMTLSNSTFDLESISGGGGIWSDSTVALNNCNVYLKDGNYGIGSNDGIDIDGGSYEINARNYAFMGTPTLSNFENKVVYGGNSKEDSYLLTEPYSLGRYSYVKTLSKFTFSVVTDENSESDITDELIIIEGENKEVNIKAKDGYRIKSLLVNNEEIQLPDDGKLTFNSIDKNIVIKVVSEKVPVEVVNPETADNILIYVITSILSIFGLAGAVVLAKKYNSFI